jgi:hypothetical protein
MLIRPSEASEGTSSKMVNHDERMASLSPERRAKIEARTDELHREYLVLLQLWENLQLIQVETPGVLGQQ